MFKNFACFMSPEKVFDKCAATQLWWDSPLVFVRIYWLTKLDIDSERNDSWAYFQYMYYALAVEELTRGEIDILSVF